MFFFPPNRWVVGALTLVGVSVLVAAHSWPIAGWAHGDLAAVSAEFRQAVVLAGVLVAGMSAWVGSSVSRPNLAHVPAGSVRRGRPLVVAQVSFLFGSAVLGMVLGLSPAVVVVSLSSDYGSLDWLEIASGVLSLGFYAAGGYVVGCVVSHYAAVPLALLLAYLLPLVMPGALSPVFGFDIISGQRVPTYLNLIRSAFFLVAAVLLAGASVAWLRRRSVLEQRSANAAVLALLAPLLVVVWSARSFGAPLVEFDNATPVCEETAEFTLCVHPSRVDLLNPLFTKIVDVADAVGGAAPIPGVIYDATLDVTDPSALPLQIQAQDRGTWLASGVGDVVAEMVGVQTCVEAGVPSEQALEVSSGVGAWVLAQIGEDPNLLLQGQESRNQFEVLESLSRDDVRRLISERRVELSRCQAEPLAPS